MDMDMMSTLDDVMDNRGSMLGSAIGSTLLPLEQYVGARMKMDELFIYWLSLKESRQMIETNLEALVNDMPVEQPAVTSLLVVLQSTTSPSSPSPRNSLSPRKSNTSGPAPPSGLATQFPRSPTPAKSPHSANHSSNHHGQWGSPGAGGSAGSRADRFDRYHIERLGGELRTERSDSISSTKSLSRRSESPSGSSLSLPSSKMRSRTGEHIPPFFVKGEGGRGRGVALASDQLHVRQEEVDLLFRQHPQGVSVEDFVPVTKTLCGFPSFFNAVLFKKILNQSGREQDAATEGARVTKPEFENFWRTEMEPYDHIDRFFRAVKKEQNDFIETSDFEPFIRELLMYHPGLEFLESHPDFHAKYAATVITRILYEINTMRNGVISARELRKSNLVEAFSLVDEEEDINKVTEFFSYEHFYVLFCRFYELDTDRDGKLSREDLLKYGEHGMSKAIVDRIMEVGQRPWGPKSREGANADTMSYDDYVYFMLSEEDKGNERSLRYWFECGDLDGDGRIGHMEMRFFYNMQIHRMESLGHEVVPYEDVICQMWDMLKLPGDRQYVTLEDLIKEDVIMVSGVFFDALFNLNKFIAFEQRDPFAERQKRNDPFETDWDRFAYQDYNRLAAEDERDGGDGMELDAESDWIVTSDDEG